jgi:proteasome lid subunit RPN8/RPN11
MKLAAAVLEEIKTHTFATYPQEMCGIVTANGFVPFKNVSPNPEISFAFDPIQYAKHVPETLCIVHSHCRKQGETRSFDIRTPSVTDLAQQKRSNKPWAIVGCDGTHFLEPVWLPRTSSESLLGRRFIPYINDCFTLAEDYFRFILGREFIPYAENFDWPALAQPVNLFEQFLSDPKLAPVTRIEDLQNGDLLIVDFRGRIASHLCIYDNGELLHQDILSCKIPFSTFANRIYRIIRYVG